MKINSLFQSFYKLQNLNKTVRFIVTEFLISFVIHLILNVYFEDKIIQDIRKASWETPENNKIIQWKNSCVPEPIDTEKEIRQLHSDTIILTYSIDCTNGKTQLLEIKINGKINLPN